MNKKSKSAQDLRDAAEPEPGKMDSTNANLSRDQRLALIAAVVLTVCNAGLAGWGINLASKSERFVQDAESAKREAERSAKQAREQIKVIENTIVSSYLMHDSQLLREFRGRLVDLPGFEIKGKEREKTISFFKLSLKSLDILEEYVPAKHQTKTRSLIEAFLEFDRQNFEKSIENLYAYTEDIPEKYLLLSASYLRLRKPHKAKMAALKVRELTGTRRNDTIRAKALVSEATSYGMEKQYKQAEELLLLSLKVDPRLFLARINLAALYSETSRFDETTKQLCEIHSTSDISVFDIISGDKDGSFDSYKSHLGIYWKRRLMNFLFAC